VAFDYRSFPNVRLALFTALWIVRESFVIEELLLSCRKPKFRTTFSTRQVPVYESHRSTQGSEQGGEQLSAGQLSVRQPGASVNLLIIKVVTGQSPICRRTTN